MAPSIGLPQTGQVVTFMASLAVARFGGRRTALGFARLGLGRLALATGRGRVRRLRPFLLGLRALLVRLAAVVRLVEAGPLEEDRGPGAEEATQRLLVALGTD